MLLFGTECLAWMRRVTIIGLAVGKIGLQSVRCFAAAPQADQRIDGKSFGAAPHCKLRDGLVTREVRVEIILRCQMAVEGRKCRDDEIGGYAVCPFRSEEHTSELQSLMRISYAVFCLKKKN